MTTTDVTGFLRCFALFRSLYCFLQIFCGSFLSATESLGNWGKKPSATCITVGTPAPLQEQSILECRRQEHQPTYQRI